MFLLVFRLEMRLWHHLLSLDLRLLALRGRDAHAILVPCGLEEEKDVLQGRLSFADRHWCDVSEECCSVAP